MAETKSTPKVSSNAVMGLGTEATGAGVIAALIFFWWNAYAEYMGWSNFEMNELVAAAHGTAFWAVGRYLFAFMPVPERWKEENKPQSEKEEEGKK